MRDNPDFFAKVIKDSISPEGIRLTTIHARYPRIIHGEVMTHRMFSRNARSSRAVPVRTMLNEVRTAPFVPWHWGKNQKGMQAGEDHNASVGVPLWDPNEGSFKDWQSREEAWLVQRDQAADMGEAFMDAGYHKQIANRLLEPFSWIDTLISFTAYANFKALRIHADAEPHMRDLAVLIDEAREGSTPVLLQPGEWHLPYITPQDRKMVTNYSRGKDDALETLQKLCVARCARISYKPFDGDASIEKELERYDLLVGSDPLHASPAEHQATPDAPLGGTKRNLWINDVLIHEGDFTEWSNRHLHGNFTGWCQYRKTLPNEFVAD